MVATRAMEVIPVFDGINARAWEWDVWGLFLEREKLRHESPEAHCLEEVGATLRAFIDKEEEEEELKERERSKQFLKPLFKIQKKVQERWEGL